MRARLVSLLDRLPSAWRCRPAALLALGLCAGLAAFAWLADAAREGDDLAALDPGVTRWAVAARTSGLTDGAWGFTHLGGTIGVAVLIVLVIAALCARRHWAAAGLFAGTTAVTSALTMGLKLAFGRARPSVDLLLGAPSRTYSFPSGHALNTTVLMGLLAGLVLFSGASRARKAWAVVGAACVAVLVGLSRIYLAYHWMTDVLAGWSLGLAVVCAAGLVALAWRGRHGRWAVETSAEGSADGGAR